MSFQTEGVEQDQQISRRACLKDDISVISTAIHPQALSIAGTERLFLTFTTYGRLGPKYSVTPSQFWACEANIDADRNCNPMLIKVKASVITSAAS